MTGCECTGPGFCERHGVAKGITLYRLCQNDERYWQAWEKGRGPGQHKGTPREPRLRPPIGPGGMLRRSLGCSAKSWPHYDKMDMLGADCEHHIQELAESLVVHGHIKSVSTAKRFIQMAIDRGAK
jgi:hypothetical protein